MRGADRVVSALKSFLDLVRAGGFQGGKLRISHPAAYANRYVRQVKEKRTHMSKLIYGDRIGKAGQIIVGASAMIWNPDGEKLLLTRRTDNGRWCLPGGRVDPGESVTETCTREVLEETGLTVEVGKLIGVYSDPNMLLTYDDGNKYQAIGLHFDASVTGGELELSNETTDIGFFSMDELSNMDVMEHHLQRIEDGIMKQKETFVR